ncbi:MAG: hypothetical protein ACK5UC_20210 [Planctomycetaceae bacterium]
MPDSPIRVLIVEDVDLERRALAQAFQRYRARRFEACFVEHWSQLIDPGAEVHRNPPCDVGIFDLGFSSEGLKRPGTSSLPNFPELILCCTHLKRDALKVVYSANNDWTVVAQACQYGAASYLHKSTDPHEVPPAIDLLLKQHTADRRIRDSFPTLLNWLDEQRDEVRSLVRALAKADQSLLTPPRDAPAPWDGPNSPQEWHLAIIMNATNQPQVVAIGRTQLEALLLYTHKKVEAGADGLDWPREPFLHALRMTL